MTVPVWMLLAFATWTVVLLLGTVGVYRWSRILTGHVPIRIARVRGVGIGRTETRVTDRVKH